MNSRSFLVIATACTIALPAGAQEYELVDVNGTTLAYREFGAGEPLIMLHGFGESGRLWDPIVPELSSHYRLIIPDLRGHGRSENPLPYFDHRDAADDISGLLDALGVSETRALGFSTGAMTLLHVATAEAERISFLVLVGASPYIPAQAREIMRAMNPDQIPMSELDRQGLVQGDTAQARRLLRQFVGLHDSYEDVSFTPPHLATITAPTLVVHGDRDPFFPIESPVELFRSIPNSSLLILPGMGHEPFPADAEGRAYLLTSLRRFLGGEWLTPR